MVDETDVVFYSQGTPLAGRFFRQDTSATENCPIVVVMGSWLTVKEQMAATYARRLAGIGYNAFIFDCTGFGQSGGELRQAEIPHRKIADLVAAVQFLRTVSFVDPERIGVLAICASAQYALAALADNLPIKSFAGVAGWYHDPASVAPFYGGDEGVAVRLRRGQQAVEAYLNGGDMPVAPAYKDGDDRAGMHFRLDYYAEADRGAIPQWKNEMAEITWFYWLNFNGMRAADRVDTPSLMVHSDDCVFPDHVKAIYDRLAGPKELIWSDGQQIDFYDRPGPVGAAIDAVQGWFGKTL